MATAGKAGSSVVLLTTALLIGAYLIYWLSTTIYNAFFGPLAKFPGPLIRRFTIIPHALAIARGQQHTDIYKLHRQYGPVVRFGPYHIMFAGSHQTWKDVYGFRKGGVIPKDSLFYGTDVVVAHSVATSQDAVEHSRQRKIFSNAFSDRALKAQEGMIKQWSTKLSDKLAERAATGQKADMLKFYNCTTFDIMGDLTFGESLNMLEDSEYSPWVKTIFDGIRGATIMRSFKYLGAVPTYIIDDILFQTAYVRARLLEHWQWSAKRVDARLARKTTKPDIWSLVEAKDVSQGGLSKNEHHSNGNVFMIAGTETTATALSGTTYLLLTHPDALKKLTTEIRGTVSRREDLSLEGLAQMKYLQAVLQEGLRLYPPAPIDLPRRVAKGGVSIDGHFVPEGTKIGIGQYATNRLATNFKHPDKFVPERWLGDPAYAGDNLAAVEPFSIGPRNCLGKNLAWHELRILLATVLLEFDLTLLQESDNWVDKQNVYTLWDKNPLWCTLTKVSR